MGMILSHYVALLAEKLGLSVAELCAESGLKPEDIWDRNHPLSSEAQNLFVDAMIRHTGDEMLMLRPLDPKLASLDNPLWYYVNNAETVREAMARGERAYLFLSDYYHPKFVELGQEAELQWASRSDRETRNHQVDWMLSAWWCISSQFAGPALKLKAVRLSPTTPERVTAYEKFFQVPVRIGPPKDALVYDIEMLDLPNMHKDIDPNLDMLLSRYIQEGMPNLESERNVFEEVFDAIQHQLLHGMPTIENVARRLGMSTRTLQRRLSDHEKTFSNLVRDVRRELATSYLHQDDLAITEVAFMLGFANANSFSIFFRKWYDLSPSQYRQQKIVAADI